MIYLFRAAFLAVAVFLLCGTSFGQIFDEKQTPSSSQTLQQQLQQQQQNLQNLQTIKTPVLDGPINPAEYIVGPGDIYSVNVWISPPVSFQLPVTPEGSVIIPTVGEIHVAGLHLDEAKKKVIADVRKKYIAGDISFTLMIPRVFAVTVKGVVKKGGVVYVQAGERVNAAVALANNVLENQAQNNLLPEERMKNLPRNLIVQPDSVGSRRRIIIRHKDGTTAAADLEKYYVQHDPRLDPLLEDGDVVIVPKQNIDKDFIGVYGAVNGEGTYEFVQGDSLICMLKIARGLTELADSSRVEITRSDSTGDRMKTFTVNLSSIVAGRSPDLLLKRGDRIVVREKLELRRDYKVFVEGEVMYPGYYPITRDSTTLTEIIQQAGGFKNNASLSSARIVRTFNSSKDVRRQQLESARGVSMEEDSINYNIESRIRMSGELVSADFVSLFLKHDRTKDLYLRDGDHIIIPSRKNEIYVFGQVVNPGYVPFIKGEDYSFYIEKAGGLTDEAVKGDIKIIKANNKQWLSPGETMIEEGDYVWVPKEPYRKFSYYLQVYSEFFGIIGTVATVAVLVIQATKK